MAPRPGTPSGSRAFALPGGPSPRDLNLLAADLDRPPPLGQGTGSRAVGGGEALPLVNEDWSWIRNTRRWKGLVNELCVPGSVCGICRGERGPILFDVRPRHPLSRSLDHILPLAQGGDPWAYSNLQPAHFGCNSGKRDRVQETECLRGWSW